MCVLTGLNKSTTYIFVVCISDWLTWEQHSTFHLLVKNNGSSPQAKDVSCHDVLQLLFSLPVTSLAFGCTKITSKTGKKKNLFVRLVLVVKENKKKKRKGNKNVVIKQMGFFPIVQFLFLLLLRIDEEEAFRFVVWNDHHARANRQQQKRKENVHKKEGASGFCLFYSFSVGTVAHVHSRLCRVKQRVCSTADVAAISNKLRTSPWNEPGNKNNSKNNNNQLRPREKEWET